ncbi:MAG: hypothetical protein ONB06_12255 [candidate division KSB1 bacterium]|nr:hypothetical protein [candidate division KSB1 bacterium]
MLEDVMDILTHLLSAYYPLRGWRAGDKVPEEKKQALGLTK